MTAGKREGREQTDSAFLVGAAEVDITPPLGVPMAGSLNDKRGADGIADPLMLKVIVLESGGVRLACASFDLCYLPRTLGDKAVAEAAAATGIAADHITWSCTHTHSGPVSWGERIKDPDSPMHEWLAELPARFAECVKAADAAQVPARVSRARAYGRGVGENRRLRYKDGRELNRWVLGRDPDEHQCVGSADLIDPEIGMLIFEDLDGQILSVLWTYALHANAKFGMQFSADYPGVTAARLREKFGDQTIALYLPGTCGDINPNGTYEQVGNKLAEAMIPKIESRKPWSGPIPLAACKKTITVPCRDYMEDQEQRIRDSLWGPASQDYFRSAQKRLQREGVMEREAVLHAWHLGDTGFVAFPGEVFVRWGLKVKQESPFPWTFPVELSNGPLGYLITQQAWEAGGYEALVAYTGLISVRGVEMMVEEGLAMLGELHASCAQEQTAAAPALALG